MLLRGKWTFVILALALIIGQSGGQLCCLSGRKNSSCALNLGAVPTNHRTEGQSGLAVRRIDHRDDYPVAFLQAFRDFGNDAIGDASPDVRSHRLAVSTGGHEINDPL
jgi:hypothetical protein